MRSSRPTPRDMQQLVRAVARFHAARPWERLSPHEPIALELPGAADTWFLVVIDEDEPGGFGSGLRVAQGRRGAALLRSITVPDHDGSLEEYTRALAAQPDVEHTGYLVERAGTLPPGQRERLVRSAISLRRDAPAPDLSAHRGSALRALDAQSVRVLTAATLAVVAASRERTLPTGDDPDGFLTLRLTGTLSDPRIETCWAAHGIERAEVWPRDRAAAWAPAASAPPEVARWRRVEHAGIELIQARILDHGLPDRHATRRYFGVAPELDSHAPGTPEIVGAWFDWTARHVRRPRGSPTVLECLLADASLDADMRRYVEAQTRAEYVLFRVDATDAEAGWVEGVDVLGGAAVRFHDAALARSARREVVVPLSLARIDDVVLPSIAGPPLGGAPLARCGLDDALAFLESEGLRLTPRGLAAKPHLLGRLWNWHRDRLDAPPPELRNTDGDPLVPCVLTFRVADSAALLAMLQARGDVHADGDAEWSWIGPPPASSPHAFEGGVRLARLELEGDALRVEVNSTARALLVREWLERTPALHFLGMRKEPLGGAAPLRVVGPGRGRADAQKGGDDDLDPADRAALVDVIGARMRAHYLAWLDEPLPAFEGRSPRAVARTPSGRARVAAMIRTLPSPFPGLDLAPLRAELLAAIGARDS